MRGTGPTGGEFLGGVEDDDEEEEEDEDDEDVGRKPASTRHCVDVLKSRTSLREKTPSTPYEYPPKTYTLPLSSLAHDAPSTGAGHSASADDEGYMAGFGSTFRHP